MQPPGLPLHRTRACFRAVSQHQSKRQPRRAAASVLLGLQPAPLLFQCLAAHLQ